MLNADRSYSLTYLWGRASTQATSYPLPFVEPDNSDGAEKITEWLRALWKEDEFRDALEVSSHSLAEGIEAVVSSPEEIAWKRLRKIATSTYGYLARWQRRATPYGLWAGVFPVELGRATEIRFGDDNAYLSQPDGTAIAANSREKETRYDAQMHVVANALAYQRDHRLIIPASATPEALERGAVDERSMSITPPIAFALSCAAKPVALGRIETNLSALYPNTSPEAIRHMLTGLVHNQALISEHRVSTIDIGEATTVEATLATAPTDKGRAWHVSLDATAKLPFTVANDIESAAETITALSPYPYGRPEWRTYLQIMLERYGPGTPVPVTELVSDAGIGYPTGYLTAAKEKSPRYVRDRDAALLALLHRAAREGRDEVVLTDEVIEQLRTGKSDDRVLPPRVEMLCALHADTPTAIDEGSYRLWVHGLPRPESSITGRFAPLLAHREPRTVEKLSWTYELPLRVAAQVSFWPRLERNLNVAAVPSILDTVIPLGEYPPHNAAHVINIDDLAVMATPSHLHLIRISTKEPVEATTPHALDASVHTPPLARFLSEVSAAGRTYWGPFDFGLAATLPFLPRLRQGRTILSPARWLLSRTDLPGPSTTLKQWREALEAWRVANDASAYVECATGSTRMPLNLTDAWDAALLRSTLQRYPTVELAEHPGAPSQDWSGRACEFVATLQTSTVPPRPTVPNRSHSPMELPGGSILAATITCHPERISPLIAEAVPELLTLPNGQRPRWWVSRHRDLSRPDSHQELKLCLRASNVHDEPVLLTALMFWAERQRERGLLADMSLTSWRYHSGVWGPCQELAEALWEADSHASVAELSTTGVGIDAITAVSVVDSIAALSLTHEEGWARVLDGLAHKPVGVDRRIRDQVRGFDISAYPGLGQAWSRRRQAAQAYARASGEAAVSVRAWAHQVIIRRCNIDPNREQAIIRLARDLARARLHQQ